MTTSTSTSGEPTITMDQARDLFARHCECRPLDLTRTEGDHAAKHDCDTQILHDIQIAVGLLSTEDAEERHRAQRCCAEYLTWMPNGRGGYRSPQESP